MSDIDALDDTVLSDKEREWLLSMPSWTYQRHTGEHVLKKFDALVAIAKEAEPYDGLDLSGTSLAGPFVHRCECFGTEDGPDGDWRACPPYLCEADLLLARAERAERERDEARQRVTDVTVQWDVWKESCKEAEARVAALELVLNNLRGLAQKEIENNRALAIPGYRKGLLARAVLATPDTDCDHALIAGTSRCIKCGRIAALVSADTKEGTV